MTKRVKEMPIIPPSTAVESDHWLTGILKILKMAMQNET